MVSTAPNPVPGATTARLSALTVLFIWVSFILVARGSARASLMPLDIAWLRFAFSGLMVLPLAWHFRRALVDGLSASAGSHAAVSGASVLARSPRSGPGATAPDEEHVPTEAPRLRLAGRRALALTATGGLGYCLCAYHGFFLAPASHGAVLLPGTLPLWSTLAALWLLGERLTASRVAGLALILAGGAIVAGANVTEALGGQGTWRGDLLFLVASMMWGVYGVLCRRWRVGALPATAAIAVTTLVLVVPAYLLAVVAGLVPSRLFSAPLGEVAFQAVYQGGLAMLVAGVAFTQVVAHYGPVRTTMFTAIVPPLASLAAVPVLGEPLSASALAGLACVTVGLLVGSGIVDLRRRSVGAAR